VQICAHAIVLRVVNRRADRSRLDDQRRLNDQLESESAALKARLPTVPGPGLKAGCRVPFDAHAIV